MTNNINDIPSSRFIELTDLEKSTSDPFNKNVPATRKRRMFLKSEVKGLSELDEGCSVTVESAGKLISHRFLEDYDQVSKLLAKPF